jgi:hypothetical protein
VEWQQRRLDEHPEWAGVAKSSTLTINIDGAVSGTLKQLTQMERTHLGNDLSALIQNKMNF